MPADDHSESGQPLFECSIGNPVLSIPANEKNPDLSQNIIRMSLGALGVVYGDIGTSPLYTVKECFHGPHAMALEPINILGVMSLIFWSMTMIVTIKYVSFILKADNHGEGGIYALTALFLDKGKEKVSRRSASTLTLLAILGASLLYGDGIITPVISVLSAVEGLNVATQAAEPFVLPVSCAILTGLFLIQRQGTDRIGKVFGPIMLIWFSVIGLMGLVEIVNKPVILSALNPAYAIQFFHRNGLHGIIVLGSVVLCLTGGEALYADMGHFGRTAIRISWMGLVFPALVLNYFGQTALLLDSPAAAHNPFYELAPRILLYPLVILSTAATVIASQAMITGVFSLTQQAIQIGYCPRLRIVHTSRETRGQIYMPWVNMIMLLGCLGLALFFKQSSRLASAYGIAVTGTMAITTLIYYYVVRFNWGWSRRKALVPVLIFLFFDLSYFIANLFKFMDGGWFAILVALVLAAIMVTWRDGRAILAKRMTESQDSLPFILKDIETRNVIRIPGSAAFMSVSPNGIPLALLHHLKHNHTLPEQAIILSIITADSPFIQASDRLKIQGLQHGFHRVVAVYGFMETPDMDEIVKLVCGKGIQLDLVTTSFYLSRETLIPSDSPEMAYWRKILFIFLSRNAWNVSTFFGIPPNRVVELGGQFIL